MLQYIAYFALAWRDNVRQMRRAAISAYVGGVFVIIIEHPGAMNLIQWIEWHILAPGIDLIYPLVIAVPLSVILLNRLRTFGIEPNTESVGRSYEVLAGNISHADRSTLTTALNRVLVADGAGVSIQPAAADSSISFKVKYSRRIPRMVSIDLQTGLVSCATIDKALIVPDLGNCIRICLLVKEAIEGLQCC